MMHNVETHLPVGWSIAKISEIAEVNPRLKVPAHEASSTVSFVPMTAVEAETGAIDLSRTRHLSDVRKGYHYFRARDVLFAKITPCMENGKMVVVPRLEHGIGFGSTEFHVLRPHREISPDYLYRFVSAAPFRRDAEHHMTGAVGQRRVPTSYLAEQRIPLPPAKEQRRIAAKIDELFSALEAGIESLKKARAQLATYRQAVLKHAFEGKLTAHWREENKERVETPEQLIARLKQKREAHYEQRLREWKAAVKTQCTNWQSGRKPSKPKKPDEPLQLGTDEVAGLPSLPAGHVYTHLANLGNLERGTSKHRPRNAPNLFGGPYPFIQTAEVKSADRVIRRFDRTYNELGLAQSRLWKKGTLCITIAANIAETAFLGFDGCFPDSVVGFTATEKLVLPKYVELFIKSVRTRIEAYAPATAQKNINLAVLEKLVIPLCSLREQIALLDRIEATFSVINEQMSAIERHLQSADALRHSILRIAFTGRLTPQDPSDEPTSVLLAKIRAAREQTTKSTTRRKKTKVTA